MKHLDVFWHKNSEESYYIMVRNKNTSYALGEYTRKQYGHMLKLVSRYKEYSDMQILGLYRIAKERNILCSRHTYSFADQRRLFIRALQADELKWINQHRQSKGMKLWKRGYAICALLPNRIGEVIVEKKEQRKQCESIVKSWREQYTMEELLQKICELLERRRQEWLQKHQKSN